MIELFNKFGTDICQALPFFHAFSGCDTSSSFFGKGKSTFWDAWMSFSKSTVLTQTFIELSNSPLAVSEENLRLIEEFLLYLYFGKDHKYIDINEARCTSFFKSPDPKLRETILSKDALLEHIKRSAYQAGWLWKECLYNVILPDPEIWGWKMYFESCTKYFPRWQREDSIITIQDVVSTCGCKKSN